MINGKTERSIDIADAWWPSANQWRDDGEVVLTRRQSWFMSAIGLHLC